MCYQTLVISSGKHFTAQISLRYENVGLLNISLYSGKPFSQPSQAPLSVRSLRPEHGGHPCAPGIHEDGVIHHVIPDSSRSVSPVWLRQAKGRYSTYDENTKPGPEHFYLRSTSETGRADGAPEALSGADRRAPPVAAQVRGEAQPGPAGGASD